MSAVSAPTAIPVPLMDLTPLTAQVRADVEASWSRILAGSDFIGGAEVDRFETEWAAFCGCRHAVGVANGTDAIELTLRGLGIGPGDEVIVPANTFVATVEAIVLAGATPRFVDVDERTLLLTPEIAEAALGERTAAVIAVDLYGNLPRLDELAELADRAGIVLIEDAAQAHGATMGGRPAGSFGKAGCFSFYPTKGLGAFGDAGCIVTDDAALADAVRVLADHGRPPDARHLHTVLARNSRLDALQASVLLAKLPHLEAWNRDRRSIAGWYDASLPQHVRRVETTAPSVQSALHQYVIRVEDRESVRAALADAQIGTGVHYPVPCHRQAPYRRFASEDLPIVENAAAEILSLPLFPHMSVEQTAHVCAGLRAAVGGTVD
jgi:dTDP-4-amino-4,6-dideoxygalactose transaminase